MHLEAISFFVKFLGSLLVVAGCVGIGFFKSSEITRRIEALKEIQRVMLLLKNEIRYIAEPLPDAMQKVADRCSGRYRDFFLGVEKALYQKEGESLSEIWKENVYAHLSDVGMTAADLHLVCEIGENIGYLDKEMQLLAMDLYMENLAATIEHLSRQAPARKRLCQCIGAFTGLLMVIMLI